MSYNPYNNGTSGSLAKGQHFVFKTSKDISANYLFIVRVEKAGSTGSTLLEHPRFSPGTHTAKNYAKDVQLKF